MNSSLNQPVMRRLQSQTHTEYLLHAALHIHDSLEASAAAFKRTVHFKREEMYKKSENKEWVNV